MKDAIRKAIRTVETGMTSRQEEAVVEAVAQVTMRWVAVSARISADMARQERGAPSRRWWACREGWAWQLWGRWRRGRGAASAWWEFGA